MEIFAKPDEDEDDDLVRDEDEEVEKILDHIEDEDNEFEYLLKWKDADECHNSWHHESDLTGCEQLIANLSGRECRTGCRSKPNGSIHQRNLWSHNSAAESIYAKLHRNDLKSNRYTCRIGRWRMHDGCISHGYSVYRH